MGMMRSRSRKIKNYTNSIRQQCSTFIIAAITLIIGASCFLLVSGDTEQQTCIADLNAYDETRYKDTYTVGVLAIRGFEKAYQEFDATFTDYLTAVAGSRFYPKTIKFEMKPLNFISLFTDVEDSIVDFIYVNPSAFSCIESQYGANSLASQISRRKIGDKTYHLTQFGGVIFALADNSKVNVISDIKDKVVAAASISGLGSGQMQFNELIKAGLSYINDPKQMVFTSNQGLVVNGVLSGAFDVGYVRTDQLERTIDKSTGQLVDLSKVKLIEPKPNLEVDAGVPFPFNSSTPLYPEWNIASLTHVPNEISNEVQSAMLNIEKHAIVGDNITTCYMQSNCTTGETSLDDECKRNCNDIGMTLDTTCKTTPEIAISASTARNNGKFTGWRTTLSYMQLRNMQEDTGFIRKNEATGTMECMRSKNIYDAIVCPVGHFKKSKEEVENGCANAGLPCADNFQCVCSPCVKAFDVDVFVDTSSSTFMSSDGTANQATNTTGCAKMSNCGTTQQTKPLKFLARDNKQREDLQMKVKILEGDSYTTVHAEPSKNISHQYEFAVQSNKVGVMILEILANDEQIPESPLRVEVNTRDCSAEFGKSLLKADGDGQCLCAENSISIGDDCVALSILLPCILIPIVLLFMVATYYWMERKRKLADSVWSVKSSELTFDEPPEIIGRGTFGLVLLAEYRGTQVAVKRVIPPLVNSKRGSKVFSLMGKGDVTEYLKNDVEKVSTKAKRRISIPQARRSSSSVAFFDNDNLVSENRNNESNNGVFQSNNSSKVTSSGDGWGSGLLTTLPTRSLNNYVKKTSSSGDGGIQQQQQQPKKSKKKVLPAPKWYEKMRYRDEYSKLKEDFIVEMRHLSKLRHPCITTVMGAVVSKKEEPMLVMEYMDHGSLYDLLHNETMVIEGAFVLPILRDIAQGVRFLHAATPTVIHGDLKAQNILVDSKFRAKVADFGLSQKKRVGATGTPLWMAPELLTGESENTTASDVYSFGIILYEVYSRKHPYHDEDLNDVLELIADPVINKRPTTPESMPPAVASLMKDCLLRSPEARPTFTQLDTRLKELDVSNVEPGDMNSSHQVKKLEQAERSEDLLFEVFPQHVAEAIRDGRKVEPESRECVTIFFSDIVGFTDISSKLSALQVSDMLDRLYLKFDEISRLHDVFKVETIGDAYMAVTNLVKDQPDQAKRIAEFAIDAVRAANETLIDLNDPEKGYVNIRVGFHSGPVVANVVGSRNPRYCLFGDTVNTASRMESNSIVNRIHCSRRAAKLLYKQAPDIPIVTRGKIHIKGKGNMRTYWVNEEGGSSYAPVSRRQSSMSLISEDENSVTDVDADDFHKHTNASSRFKYDRTPSMPKLSECEAAENVV